MILLFMNPWMNANDLGALRHTVTKCSSCKWSSFWGDSVAAGSPPSRCSALLNNCRNDLHHIQVPFLHVTPDRRLRSFCLRLCLPSSRPWSITGGRRPNFGRAAASPLTWFGTTSQKHLTWFRGLRRRRGSVPVLNQIVSSRRRSALAGDRSQQQVVRSEQESASMCRYTVQCTVITVFKPDAVFSIWLSSKSEKRDVTRETSKMFQKSWSEACWLG